MSDDEIPAHDEVDDPILPTSRVESFSDAVFAIAATLLVLSISVPIGTTDATLGHALRHDALPHVISYAISFAVIGQFWLGHHRLVASLERVDDTFLSLNLLLLGLIAILPFPTAILGQFGTTLAVTLYATNVAAAAATAAALSVIGSRHHLFRPGLAPTLHRRGLVRTALPTVVFTLSIPIAILFGPTPAELFWILLLLARPLLNHFAPRPSGHAR
jgi:uncharacterized membrane protein